MMERIPETPIEATHACVHVFLFFFSVLVGLGKSNKHTLIILCIVGSKLIGTLWKLKRNTVCCISLCSCTEKARIKQKKKDGATLGSDRLVVVWCAIYGRFLNNRLVPGQGVHLLSLERTGNRCKEDDSSCLYFYRLSTPAPPPPFDRYMSNMADARGDTERRSAEESHSSTLNEINSTKALCVFCFWRETPTNLEEAHVPKRKLRLSVCVHTCKVTFKILKSEKAPSRLRLWLNLGRANSNSH